ncbi:MAG TPA: hypothetical protein VED01_21400 [Burkholderiales bacterium]|nr:hypothetical protein [Burkholderiales bacterium]
MTLAAGQNQDFARLQPLTKRIYGTRVAEMLPKKLTVLADLCPFRGAEKGPGDDYYEPVRLTRSTGVTYNKDGSAFALRKGLASNSKPATIRGTEILVRDVLSYAAMKRAAGADTSNKAGQRAFVNATKDVFTSLAEAGAFYRELELLYGCGGIADASAAVTGLAQIESITTNSGGVLAVVIRASKWAPAIWLGCENGEYDIYSAAGTKRNTAGSDSARTTIYKLDAIAPATRTLTFSSEQATNVANVAVNDWIFVAGNRANSMMGLDAICQTSGNVFGISNTDYALWKPQAVDVGGQLSFEAIMNGAAYASEHGFHGKLHVLVSPRGWTDLVNDQASLVRHSESKGGTVRMGYEKIEYYGPTGNMAITPHILMHQGSAFGVPEGELERIGSTDLTFEMPMIGRMLSELEDNAGAQARIYADQALFGTMLKGIVRWHTITNSTS